MAEKDILDVEVSCDDFKVKRVSTIVKNGDEIVGMGLPLYFFINEIGETIQLVEA